jgi:hypothetical protein
MKSSKKFVKFVATKKRLDNKFSSPSFVAVVRSGNRDSRSEIRDLGLIKIRILDQNRGSTTP